MNQTGRIQSIVPTQEGGYSGANGYIHTFNMTILTPDNQQYVGVIGSKSEIYPLAPGSEISVTITDDAQHGRKFTRFNPQYAQQGQQAAPRTPQQATQQANQSIQQAAQGAKSNKPDWDAISRGKVRHGIVCAYIKSGKEPNIQDVELWVDYVMTGQKAGFDQFAAQNPPEQDNF